MHRSGVHMTEIRLNKGYTHTLDTDEVDLIDLVFFTFNCVGTETEKRNPPDSEGVHSLEHFHKPFTFH